MEAIKIVIESLETMKIENNKKIDANINYLKSLLEKSVVKTEQMPISNNNEIIENRPFNLQTFIQNSKNENVRTFYNCKLIDGQSRTKTAWSAIGSLGQVKCPKEIILKLVESYCNETGCDRNKLEKILNNIQ